MVVKQSMKTSILASEHNYCITYTFTIFICRFLQEADQKTTHQPVIVLDSSIYLQNKNDGMLFFHIVFLFWRLFFFFFLKYRGAHLQRILLTIGP